MGFAGYMGRKKMETGFGSTEQMAMDAGHKQINIDDFLRRAVGKTVLGNYMLGFVFYGYMGADGSIDGENNVGTRDTGHWAVNHVGNTFLLKWHGGWVDSITRIYDIDGALHFFDRDTGAWRMSFVELVAGRQVLALG